MKNILFIIINILTYLYFTRYVVIIKTKYYGAYSNMHLRY